MKEESELYIKYIQAFRNQDQQTIEHMIRMGFKADKKRLMELMTCDPLVRETLFNREITIHIDAGDTAGHVYGKFPIYDESGTKIKEAYLGFYPKTSGVLNALIGEGAVLNEVETLRRSKQFETVEVHLPISEEAWRALAAWTYARTKEKHSYVIVKENCLHFVDEALKVAGFSDGLVDKFDPKKVNKLKFKPAMLDLNHYLRYDTREDFMPAVNSILDSRSSALDTGTYVWHQKEAKRLRERANQLSQQSFVNGFFERYHNKDFYQSLFREKTLTLDDMAWLLRNQASGMESQIRDRLLQGYQEANASIKAAYHFNPQYFLWDMAYQLQTSPEKVNGDIKRQLANQKFGKKESSSRMLASHSELDRLYSVNPLRILSRMPTFFYLNSEPGTPMTCENTFILINQTEQTKRQALKSVFILESQAFSRDCEKGLNRLLSGFKPRNEQSLFQYSDCNGGGLEEYRKALIPANSTFESHPDQTAWSRDTALSLHSKKLKQDKDLSMPVLNPSLQFSTDYIPKEARTKSISNALKQDAWGRSMPKPAGFFSYSSMRPGGEKTLTAFAMTSGAPQFPYRSSHSQMGFLSLIDHKGLSLSPSIKVNKISFLSRK